MTFAAVLPAAAVAGGAEVWTIRIDAREGAQSVVAQRSGSAGREAFTLADSATRTLAVPAIALDGRGGGAAAWVSAAPGDNAVVASRFDGRAWSAPATVVRSTRHLGQPTLAADGRGGYWIAVTQAGERGDDIALHRWDGATARPVRIFGERGRSDVDPWLERSASGEVRLRWRGSDGTAYRRREAVVAPGGPLPQTPAAASGPPAFPDAASLQTPPSGSRAAAAWSDGERVFSAPLPGQAGEGGAPTAAPRTMPAPEVAAGPPDLSRILGLGDSTTWGRGSSYDGPPTDYLTRLENQLHGPWTVFNGGHAGFTSTDLLDAADADLQWRPGLTLLMVGINDAFMVYSADTVYLNVRDLVDKIRAAGSAVVVATTTPVIDDASRLAQHQYLQDVVNPAIREAARDAGAPVVDLWSYFLGLPDWRTYIYTPHGNHLNDAGYELVATRFKLLLQRNDLNLPVRGTARGPLLADVSLGAWDLPVPGALDAAANAGAASLFRDTVSPLADNGIVASALVDLDGDGVDGVAVVRARFGEISLVVYNAPPAGTSTDAGVLAAVTVQATADWLPGVCACAGGAPPRRRAITHLFALDQDGDGRDELGFVCSRTCATDAGLVERQVLELWRANQPGVATPRRLVLDEWLLPGGGWIHDVAAIQADADAAQEVLVLTQNPKVSSLQTLGATNPDLVQLLPSGRYGRLFDCATTKPPASWGICDRWIDRGKGECGVLELRTLTPRVLVYDTPPAGANTKAENNEPLLYSLWLTESPLLAAHCVDTGEEWAERFSDALGVAAADVTVPPDGKDELLLLRLRAADSLETWSLPPLPAGPAKQPRLIALDKWVRTALSSHQYLMKAGAIPDGLGGAKPALLFWLDKP